VRKVAGDFHSFFCEGGTALVVNGDALCVVYPDFSLKPLRNVTAGASMEYAQVDDAIYYCNGIETGKVQDELSWPWEYSGERVGPETDRDFQSPPVGNIVRHFKGKMYVVRHDTVWYSEPYDHSAFDMVRNFLKFDSGIIMFRPVERGIFVSDHERVYFLRGDSVQEKFFEKVGICNYPAIRGMDEKFMGRLNPVEGSRGIMPFVDTEMGELGTVFTSKEGICYGGPDGEFYNLTDKKIDFPGGSSGCGQVWKGKYISILNP
jgi:hypothetical protein